jgi:hypothetical protein
LESTGRQIIGLAAAFASATSAQEFEVASIKRNATNEPGRYIPPAIRPGQFTAISMSIRMFTALQEQLGLKLQPTTVQGQVLVVEHIERPFEN